MHTICKCVHINLPWMCFICKLVVNIVLFAFLIKVFYHIFNTISQQSAAFKILKTRLKAVPSYSFNGEQLNRTSSGNPHQIVHQISGSQAIEDGNITSNGGKSHNGIDFSARLQQFEKMQYQHRMHAKAQAQLRNSFTSFSKEVYLFTLFSTLFYLYFY